MVFIECWQTISYTLRQNTGFEVHTSGWLRFMEI